MRNIVSIDDNCAAAGVYNAIMAIGIALFASERASISLCRCPGVAFTTFSISASGIWGRGVATFICPHVTGPLPNRRICKLA